ncbi:N-acetyl-anhydromuranmyl-L-alanine amidase [Catenovulum agarivorans DS-2]|uniref:1,6-anhydro-N-acetylmuramyl-L-alanine amidase AmpD n=1 Tax=Catenovulum agarivorans DS-2 TaxID=1328313 RepID=W7QVW2_9ALTE|nr:1,6-anhydro-N-acetylmuramyl-L-alanine amidase AmpD [Catenovulum agarivorans]EWH11868.1 N-acetyl-anhydromuranmyl-L-alanine amidase [Catenovulum agarivorans DS-2]
MTQPQSSSDRHDILTDAVFKPSKFFNTRPDNIDIDLLVIHCISLPEGEYGLPYIEDLFLGCLDCNQHASFADLVGLEVSAHFFIKRNGEIIQFVPMDLRAWHAGVSKFDGRSNCNDFSIGIELEGTDKSEFTQLQYQALVKTTGQIMRLYPKITPERIVGHSDIAPGRKTDPGIGFNWGHYKQQLAKELL